MVKYRVKGGLRIAEAGDRVFWKAIFKERSAPIRRARVRSRLPAVLADQIRSFESFEVAAEARQVNPWTVEFVAQEALAPPTQTS